MQLANNRHTMHRLLASNALQKPSDITKKHSQHLNITYKNLSTNFELNHIKQTQKFTLLTNSIKNLSPLNILEKGFAIVSKNNKAIKSKQDINLGDIIKIQLKDATATAKVIEV